MPVRDPSNEQFRAICAHISDLAAKYIIQLDNRSIMPASGVPFANAVPREGMGMAALDDLEQVVRQSRAQNGRFFGYVLGSGEPVGGAVDLLASVLNQNVTSWRSAPAAVEIERAVISWLAEAIGCRAFTGSLTSGGSSANLMALAMAREAAISANETGVRADAVVYASAEVHMSIGKAVALLGIGRDNLRLIPVDQDFRMRVLLLASQIASDRASGKIPIAIVATAGTVNTGAIDPLSDIADLAQREKIWLHVDGAYGALAALAVPEKFAGLERVDSLSLDAHKWLYQSVDCGCLLYRDSSPARTAFSHTGDYAKSLSADPVQGFAFFEESLELSRRFRALRLWLSLRYHGLNAFRDSIAHDLAMANRLKRNIETDSQLEVLAPVSLSAVCFRWRGNNFKGDLNTANQKIHAALLRRGRIYLSNATIGGQFALRACITNHRTSERDIDEVVPEVLRVASEEIS